MLAAAHNLEYTHLREKQREAILQLVQGKDSLFPFQLVMAKVCFYTLPYFLTSKDAILIHSALPLS